MSRQLILAFSSGSSWPSFLVSSSCFSSSFSSIFFCSFDSFCPSLVTFQYQSWFMHSMTICASMLFFHPTVFWPRYSFAIAVQRMINLPNLLLVAFLSLGALTRSFEKKFQSCFPYLLILLWRKSENQWGILRVHKLSGSVDFHG